MSKKTRSAKGSADLVSRCGNSLTRGRCLLSFSPGNPFFFLEKKKVSRLSPQRALCFQSVVAVLHDALTRGFNTMFFSHGALLLIRWGDLCSDCFAT
ncbi:hypothetical protein AVEN_102993-1 [Araneus ventricosus]|uniref:Uncharacterized protein n=1 Tax=Araneus ventricosus TaxID=182803 RepID=A0A4Y2B7F7_ARAVE|nr:hypothetical protein AVEN_102993-1 [Araneus ventricosus]